MAIHNRRRSPFIFNYYLTSPCIHKLFTNWRTCWIVSSHCHSAYLIPLGISVILIFQYIFQGVIHVCDRNSLQRLSVWGAGRDLSSSSTPPFIYVRFFASYLRHCTRNVYCSNCYHISIPFLSNALFFSHNYLKDLKRHKKWTEFFLWEWAQ